MKRLIFCLVVLTVWLIHFTSSPVLAVQDRRIALVIGNGAYKSAPLRNPVNDAGDIADALGKLGFSVSLKTDANQRSMKRAIRAFGKQLRKGGVGLFYFAGHGIQVKGTNYLIPIGAQIESEADVEYEAVDAGRVLAQMEEAGNSLNIIVLDACRDNPFARSFRSSSRGLAKMDAPTGSILAYATAPGSVASDGPGRNGLYTSAFLKHMMTPGLEIGRLFRQVRIDVLSSSGKKQVPWEASSLTGDFYFNTQRGIAVVPKRPIKETSKYAAVSPHATKLKKMAREGRFTRQANGIVYDIKTGLEWYAGPDKDTTWDTAKRWVANLDVAGGGWRMPTKSELKGLYQKGVGTRNMTPLLKATGWWVWSGDETGGFSNAWGFHFTRGTGFWKAGSNSHSTRGFAARSQNNELPAIKEESESAPKYASISPDAAKPKIVARDAHYEKYANGIVRDTRTGLEWYAGPDKDTNWKEAKRWVASLNVDSGGWRMPTENELVGLYQKGVASRNMTALLKTTGYVLWSGETKDSSSAWSYYLEIGTGVWQPHTTAINFRAFAVRSR